MSLLWIISLPENNLKNYFYFNLRIYTLFNKLKEGGTVNMDLQETFWSKCYGSVTDKFGIQWQLSHDSRKM
jgi:uncharacterized glyoxalase superfamily protein PhnB